MKKIILLLGVILFSITSYAQVGSIKAETYQAEF